MPLGRSFAPNSDQMSQRPPGGAGQSPVQEAVRVLSLRLPRVVGASAPAPGALMGGMGGQGLAGPTSNPIVQQLMQMILGGQTAQQGGAIPGLPVPGGMPSMPASMGGFTPNIGFNTPGGGVSTPPTPQTPPRPAPPAMPPPDRGMFGA